MTGATGAEGPMRVLERAVYRGPHLYSERPMIRIQLDLGRLEAWPTDRLPGFSEALLAKLPGLDQHGCCFGRPGNSVSRAGRTATSDGGPPREQDGLSGRNGSGAAALGQFLVRALVGRQHEPHRSR